MRYAFFIPPAKEDGGMEQAAACDTMKERTALHCTNGPIRSMERGNATGQMAVMACIGCSGPIGFGRMRAASYPKDGR
jgi:hypothetical protein